MSIRIHIPTAMRQHAEGQAAVEVSAATVKKALDSLYADELITGVDRHPALSDPFFAAWLRDSPA